MELLLMFFFLLFDIIEILTFLPEQGGNNF